VRFAHELILGNDDGLALISPLLGETPDLDVGGGRGVGHIEDLDAGESDAVGADAVASFSPETFNMSCGPAVAVNAVG